MNKVVNNKNEELNANFKIVKIDNEIGLTLESRNGLHRNRDYNEALELILNRLRKKEINQITIKVVSATLLKHFPQPSDRLIKLDETSKINLEGVDLIKLRQQIGSAVSKLKVNKTKKGGNPTKRIQLISENLKEEDWRQIARGEMKYKDADFFDYDKFEDEVVEYLKKPIKEIPNGNSKPRKKVSTSKDVYERDSKVKAWILQNAKGKCECCNSESPFITPNGTPYLEVHHLKTLANSGSDTIGNTVALCPNCHREFHFGINQEKILAKMYKQIKRLKKED